MSARIQTLSARQAALYRQNANFFALNAKNIASNANSKLDRSEINRVGQIRYPFIDFQVQSEFIQEFVDQYNAKIRVKRVEAAMEGKNLNGEEFQLIKEVHVQLMKEIIRQTIGQMKDHNFALQTLGANWTDPKKPYSLFTNNERLAARLGIASDGRTVRNQTLRLRTCGFISEKVNHGTRKDFELRISPEFLFIFDLSRPDYEPTSSLLGNTEKRALPAPSRKKFPLSSIGDKRTFNNKVKSEGCSQSTKPDQEHERIDLSLEGNEPLEKNSQKQAKQECSIQEKFSDHPGIVNDRQRRIELEARARRCRQPINELDSYRAEQVEIFLSIALFKLWNNRVIFEKEVEKTLDYLNSNYFKHCKTRKDINTQLAIMTQVVDEQRNWAAQRPDRFTMLPMKFFQLERKSTSDYSGYMGILKKIKENQRKTGVSKQNRIAWNRSKIYNRELRAWLEKPSQDGYLKLEKKIRIQWPELLPDFLQVVKILSMNNQS